MLPRLTAAQSLEEALIEPPYCAWSSSASPSVVNIEKVSLISLQPAKDINLAEYFRLVSVSGEESVKMEKMQKRMRGEVLQTDSLQCNYKEGNLC